ncbi:MAG: hypothetical protein AMJ90_02085 [candidate division Zixibacteria bacterium SM23_73_2]|nr:MAG: hypothetical protein AMJ90_02085 [candidate division Zixibacteria bacterium SM23_73_2]
MKTGYLVWISFIFVGGFLFLTNSPWFGLKSVVLEGDWHNDKKEQEKFFSSYWGKNIFKIPLQDIEGKIREEPMVEKVRIERRLPSELVVHSFWKKPVFLVNLDRIYGLTESKEIIPISDGEQAYKYPIITGLGLSSFNFYQQMHTQKANLCKKIYQAVTEVDPHLFTNISEINLKDAENPVLFLLPFGVRVILGTGDYFLKIKRLKSVLAVEDLKEIKTIDLRFKDQALVKRKNKR